MEDDLKTFGYLDCVMTWNKVFCGGKKGQDKSVKYH